MFGVLALGLLLLPSTSLSQAREPAAANQRAERGVQLTIQVLGEDGNPVSIQVVPHQNLVHSENERVANGLWRDVSIRSWP
jgi:hypothetical protein